MADPFSGNVGGTAGTGWLSELSSAFGMGQQLAGIAGQLQKGGTKADIQAATSAAKLGSNLKAFGASSGNVGAFAADVVNLTNIISGIQQGGAGYAGAGINAAALVGRAGTQAAARGLVSSGVGQVASEIGAVAGPLSAAYSIYNFAKNWQSGATGADALRGAETGATIGSVVPVVGTLFGAAAGAAVGALSSAFGGGRADPETMGLDNYAPQFNKNPAIASSLTAAQNYQMLAGAFDAKNNSPGHSTALEQKYGRMGEGAFMNDIFTHINWAMQSGQISPSATPQQIYAQVVNPYLSSQTVNGQSLGIKTDGSNNYTTSTGTNFGGAMQASVINLIGQWQSGRLTNRSQIGVSGETDPNMPTYAGNALLSRQQTQASAQYVQQLLTSILGSFPMRMHV